MVINTGYASKRGRIIRKILNRVPTVPHFFKTFIYFLAETYIVGIIICFATIFISINAQIPTLMIILTFLLYVTFCFPPAFPIYFNLVYSFCLVRLKWKNIFGTEPQKTVESAHVTIMCFDKTGTLTEQKVEIYQVFNFHSQ